MNDRSIRDGRRRLLVSGVAAGGAALAAPLASAASATTETGVGDGVHAGTAAKAGPGLQLIAHRRSTRAPPRRRWRAYRAHRPEHGRQPGGARRSLRTPADGSRRQPGVTSPWLGFPAGFRKIVTEDRNATNQVWNNDAVPTLEKSASAEARFLLAKRYEPSGAEVIDAVREGRFARDIWGPSQIVQQLDVTALLPRITSPTLVLDYEGEQFYPGQAERMFSLLTGPKDYVVLTAAEGANLHCSPMAPRRHNEVIFDWLDKMVR